MPRPNPLTEGLKQARKAEQPEPPAAPVVVVASSARAVPPSRVGRVLIGGHFAPEVQMALKVLAAEERSTVQALIAEGIDAVLARRHKPQIAALSVSPQGQNQA
jgi:hypothetical protein